MYIRDYASCSPPPPRHFSAIALAIAGIFFFSAPLAVFASSTDGTIDSTYRYAWGENTGWADFGSTAGNVHITDSALTGSAYGENVGWLTLNPQTYGGVTNNAEGTLSGYAWGENAGWVDFSKVTIGSDGVFAGSAYGENIGWITFGTGNNKVSTDWRPASTRTVTPAPIPAPTPAPSGGGGGGGGGTSLGNPTSSSDKLLSLTIVPSVSSLPVQGGLVTYTYRVTNTGASYGAISNVVIVDTACSPVKYVSGDTNNDARIDINEKWTFSCSTNLSRTTRNIANVTGHASASLNAFTIAQDTTVVVGVPPTQASISSGATASGNSTPLSIKQLQQFLNTHGFVINNVGAGSPGNETNYFGSATRVALAKFQAANGITPAVGYFGPLTKAIIQSMSVNTKSVTVPSQKVVVTSSIKTSDQTIPVFTRDLDRYMTGADVMDLQAFLIKQNTGPRARDLIAIEETGYFGTLTRNALAEFQAANGITPSTGYFGPKTRSFINNLTQ